MTQIKKLFLLFLYIFSLTSNFGCLSPVVVNNSNTRYVDDQRNIEHLTNSVVALVSSSDRTRVRPYCTGFFISERILVTAAHCILRNNNLDLAISRSLRASFVTYQEWRNGVRSNGLVPVFNESTLIALDEENDVAILKTVSFNSRFYISSNNLNPLVGSRVYSMSLPGGLPWILEEGMVSGIELGRMNEINSIMSSTPLYFGSSGCPLVDNQGNLVGVAQAIGFRQSNFAIFTPTRFINQLLGTDIVFSVKTIQINRHN